MPPETASVLEMLRAKAILLLRRERELNELRRDRNRTEQWLGVFHRLSQDMHAKTAAMLFEDWVAAMVDVLSFQVAGAYRCDLDPPRGTLICERSHSGLPRELILGEAVCDYLAVAGSGMFSEAGPAPLVPLADAADLATFFWLFIATRDAQFVLLTGFSSKDGEYPRLDEGELRQFVLIGTHLSALLGNITLIDELSRETIELQRSNQQLDASLKELRDTQEKLVQSAKVLAEVSRRAGMADVATGVLHNVGNALNSVNVSAEVVVERLRTMRVSGAGRVADLLRNHAVDLVDFLTSDPQGKNVPVYLTKLGEHLVGTRDEIATELRTLQQHIEHIEWIVSKQQAYAKAIGVTEICSPTQLVDDAISLAEDSLSRLGIEVVRDYVEVPPVLLDRHRVLQILVNLVSNARHALTDSEQPHKRLVARVRLTPSGFIQIRLEDNGIGIAEEHMQRMFTHGFTTKPRGHGFGLHTSALAAREMGGSLTCTSEGRGKGAAFVLELPGSAATKGDAP